MNYNPIQNRFKVLLHEMSNLTLCLQQLKLQLLKSRNTNKDIQILNEIESHYKTAKVNNSMEVLLTQNGYQNRFGLGLNIKVAHFLQAYLTRVPSLSSNFLIKMGSKVIILVAETT